MTAPAPPADLSPSQGFRYRVACDDLAEAEGLDLSTAETTELLLMVSRLTGTVADLLRLVDQLATTPTTAPGGAR